MHPFPTELTLPCPAKVNLYLAITGLREDGFHELLSLVAPFEWGDRLTVRWAEEAVDDTLSCNYAGVPLDGSNLILQAAARMRQEVPVPGGFHFEVEKHIPPGSGLGGGSSNAAAALKAINAILGQPVSEARLLELAAALGSDCPLFLANQPVLMRGRGECIEHLPEAARACLSGQSILVFRPHFSISTVWAYRQMKAAEGAYYRDPAAAKARLENWLNNPQWKDLPLENNLEGVAFAKYLALPTLLAQIRADFGLRCMMSGSGSACFALPEAKTDIKALQQCIQEALGKDALCVATRLQPTMIARLKKSLL